MSYRNSPLFYYAAGAASLGAASLLYSTLTSTSSKPKVLPSPLSNPNASQSPYAPSDYLPGARDVSTPYGNIRVYEFGPEDASRNVLLVHGISTPCVALAGIASGLAEKGCRVMLLDLFGRGWSDAPGDLKFDDRLYTSQLFMALSSSPLNWMAGFSVIGYSMGAAIGANFTSYFPHLVEDLVLVAPAGLIRTRHLDWQTKLMYSGLLPQSVIESLVKNRLRTNPNVKTTGKPAKVGTAMPTEQGSDPIAAETANTSGTIPTAFGRPVDAEAVVRWQMDHHPGFVPAFFSSFVDAPVREQHGRWKMIATRLNAQRSAQNAGVTNKEAERQGLRTGKVLMVLGKTDRAVHSEELEPDAKAVFGEGNLEIAWFDAGHEVPITYADEITEFIWKEWEAAQ